MEYLYYSATFLIYLFIQALLINGVYISAAGTIETLPDGSKADSEMILYPLYKYLNQHYFKRIFFTMDAIKARTSSFPVVPGANIIWEGEGPLFRITPVAGNGTLNIAPIEVWAEAYLSGKVLFDPQGWTISIYQDVMFYKFSKYLRKPIITCVVCMASFWSIFTFLIPALVIFHTIIIVPIWIGNVFCLSYLNYIIFKPRK